jgi:hypothetical protein
VLEQRPLVQRPPRDAQPVQRAVLRRTWRLVGLVLTWRLVGLVCGPGKLRAGGPYQMVDGVKCLRDDNDWFNLAQRKREA